MPLLKAGTRLRRCTPDKRVHGHIVWSFYVLYTYLPDMGSPAVYDNLENQLVNCFINPHSTYLKYPLQFLVRDIGQALQLYVPVYVLPLLLFAPSKIIREPIATLTRLAR